MDLFFKLRVSTLIKFYQSKSMIRVGATATLSIVALTMVAAALDLFKGLIFVS